MTTRDRAQLSHYSRWALHNDRRGFCGRGFCGRGFCGREFCAIIDLIIISTSAMFSECTQLCSHHHKVIDLFLRPFWVGSWWWPRCMTSWWRFASCQWLATQSMSDSNADRWGWDNALRIMMCFLYCKRTVTELRCLLLFVVCANVSDGLSTWKEIEQIPRFLCV